jgi:hypothetical protein
MLREWLLCLWSWLVSKQLCPCALRGPAWSVGLCGRIDAYAWRLGFWEDGDAV